VYIYSVDFTPVATYNKENYKLAILANDLRKF